MGLEIGHSVRTVKEAIGMGSSDLVSMVSMLDARFLGGDHSLFQEFIPEQTLGEIPFAPLHHLWPVEEREFGWPALLPMEERSDNPSAFVKGG